MRKLVFLFALLFAFTSTKANNTIVSKAMSVGKSEAMAIVKKTMVVRPAVKANVAKRTVMTTCYGLSCGTVCGKGAVRGDIEAAFNALERMFCGRGYMA